MQTRLALGHSQLAGIKKTPPPGGNRQSQPARAGGRPSSAKVPQGSCAAGSDMLDPDFFVKGFKPLPRPSDGLWVAAEAAGPAAGPAFLVCLKV